MRTVDPCHCQSFRFGETTAPLAGLAGLVISGQSHTSNSAYAFRIAKLAECLEASSIRCDYFFMPDHWPLSTETTASLFLPLWLRMLRRYDFIYCGAAMAGQAFYFCHRFVPGLVMLDMHGDDIAQSALANEAATGGKCRSASLTVKATYWMAMASADYWLTQSALQQEDLINAGVPEDRVSVVRNGVDLDLFACLPNPEEPEFTFGYVGAFQVWQGINEFMEAFALVADPSVTMLMVGFSERDRLLKESLKQRFGSRLELVDRVTREAMIGLLKSVAILISARPGHLASRSAFPTKFAEYAALGRPILVTDVDETAHFVRQYECGFVAQPSLNDLAETMSQAAQAPWEVLAQMGAKARKMAEEHFSWEHVGRDYAALIREITSCKKKL